MVYDKIKITDISPAEYNPRIMSDDEMRKLSDSISEFGLVDPIIINLNNNRIIGGHQRYDVLLNKHMSDKKMYDELNIIKLGDVGWVFTEDDLKVKDGSHEKALNLALNKISGEWDFDKLTGLLEELEFDGFDVSLTGFNNVDDVNIELDDYQPSFEEDGGEKPDEENKLSGNEEDNYVDELSDDDVNVKLGDIYKLGNNRLMCGNGVEEKDISLLLENKKADVVFTDPPYELDGDYTTNIFKNTKNTGEIFIMTNERKLANIIVEYDEYFRRIFVVDFKVARLINSHMPMTQCDFIGHFRKGSPGNFKNLHDEFTTLVTSSKTSTKDKNNFNHKYAKRVGLPSEFIIHFSDEEEVVLDLFGGSGSTLIACEKLNRKCYMMELDPYYCQVIINRWEEYTGGEAEKIN